MKPLEQKVKEKGKEMICTSKRCLGENRHFVYVGEDVDNKVIYVCRRCGKIKIKDYETGVRM